jgi:hypothetical protein
LIHKEFVLEEFIGTGFESEAAVSRERWFVSFALQCPCSFCRGWCISSDELQRCGGSHRTYLLDSRFLLFPEVKSALKGRFQNTEDIEKNITIE